MLKKCFNKNGEKRLFRVQKIKKQKKIPLNGFFLYKIKKSILMKERIYIREKYLKK